MGKRLRLELVDGCHESWEAMPSAGVGRACARCERDVIDLDGKTMKQAEALLLKEQALRGSVCARYAVDPATGEAKFAEPLPMRSTAWLRGVVVAATLAAGCESIVQAAEPSKPAAVVIPLAPAPLAPPAAPPGVLLPLPPPPPLHPPIAAAPDAGVDDGGPVHPTHPPPHHLMGRIAIRP